MSHEMLGDGPFREQADPNPQALENMRKKIEAEGKIPLLIPENTQAGDEITQFIELLKKGIRPEDIKLYSVATGRLKFYQQSRESDHTEIDYKGKKIRVKEFYYLNLDLDSRIAFNRPRIGISTNLGKGIALIKYIQTIAESEIKDKAEWEKLNEK